MRNSLAALTFCTSLWGKKKWEETTVLELRYHNNQNKSVNREKSRRGNSIRRLFSKLNCPSRPRELISLQQNPLQNGFSQPQMNTKKTRDKRAKKRKENAMNNLKKQTEINLSST